MWNTLAVAVLVSLFAVGFSEKCSFAYNITNGSTMTPCVLMELSSSVGINYLKDGNKVGFMSMMVPCTTNTTHPSTVSGVCNNGTSSTNASISIVWRNETDSDIANNLTFYFQKSNSEWSVTNVSIVVDVSEIEDRSSSEDTVTARINKTIFGKVKNSRAYYCKSKSNLTLTTDESERKDFNISVALMDFKVQAFGFKTNATDYGTVSRCSQDIKGSKIVPIAVGAALAGLVVIVLIAYIIGRLRSRRQSSYEALS